MSRFFKEKKAMVFHKKVLIVLGTRPEIIKLAPVYRALREKRNFRIRICHTGQHRHLADPMIKLFGLPIHHNLKVMQRNQSLAGLTSILIDRIDEVLIHEKPDWVIVQGDTTSAMVSAIATFYRHLSLAHVEAGLRTGNLLAPFPEELNRWLVTKTASLHFAPTENAKRVLLDEGVDEGRISVTGNTVVDSLQWCKRYCLPHYVPTEIPNPDRIGKFILITTHRRENFGQNLSNICRSVVAFSRNRPEVRFIWPLHLNPHVWKPVREMTKKIRNVILIPPVSYLTLLWLMKKCRFIITDSGGIQEEAPSFKKPVLVLRNETERPEGIQLGIARLIGTNPKTILNEVGRLWDDQWAYRRMLPTKNPYGDGKAGKRIAKVLGC